MMPHYIYNRQKYVLSLLIGCLVTQNLFSQKTITLKNERLGISSKEFYIASVINESTTPNTIGRVSVGGGLQIAQLEGTTAKTIETFLRRNFNATRTDTLTPIVMVVKELSINERLMGPYQVNGELLLSVSFEIMHGGTRLKLTSGRAGSTYGRSVQNLDAVEGAVRAALENHLKNFAKWFAQSGKSHNLLAKKAVLVLEHDPTTDIGDTVYYQAHRKLAWSDFKGAVRFGSRWAAQVFTSFGFDLHAVTKNRVLEVHLKTKVFVDKSQSWARPSDKTDYVLAHEQLHFDVAKWISLQFVTKIRTMELDREDFSSEVQYQYLEYYRLLTHTQEQYDSETNHGLNVAEQRRWAAKVADGIKRFEIE